MSSIIGKLCQLDRDFAQSLTSSILLFFFASAILCFWLICPVDIQLHMPDTTSYLRFDSYRGAGYPFFLQLIQMLGIQLEQVPIIQSTLFFACLMFLCVQFKHFSGSFLFATALMVGVGMNPAIARYNSTLITESLFFSSLFILIGFLLGRMNSKILFLIGAFFAWLILIKPVSWAFICIPVLLIWQFTIEKNKPLTKAVVLISGFLIIFSAGTLYRYYHHQEWSAGSFFGNQLSGKLTFSSFEPSGTPYPVAGKYWIELMQPIHQARNEFLQEDYQRFLFALNMYDYLRFSKMPEIIALMDVDKKDEQPALKEMAFSIIKQNPQAYFYDVYLNFYNLWFIGELQSYQNSINYNNQIDLMNKKMGGSIPKPYALNEDNSIVPIIIKPFLLLAFVLNILIILYCIFVFVFRLKAMPEKLNSLFILCCSVQAYFLLTALLQAALTRYALVAWPMHLIVVLASFLFIISKIKTE